MASNNIPIGAYPFAFTTLLNITTAGVYIIKQTGDSAADVAWNSGACYLLTTSVAGLYYFVLKRPTVTKTLSTQKLAVKGFNNGWGGGGIGHGCDGCTSDMSSFTSAEGTSTCSLTGTSIGGPTTGSFTTSNYLNYSIKYTTSSTIVDYLRSSLT
jgi:hypothetical protein